MRKLRDRLYLSTTAEDAPALAREHGLGLEIAEFCTASNMDVDFAAADAKVREAMTGVERFTFHAPFNELSPAAIDPLVKEIAYRRYRQAIELSPRYGAKKIVVHSGFVPLVYFPSWFSAQSVPFWREILHTAPRDVSLCLENVMESGPDMLLEIVEGVNDPRFRLCLDVGHAACMGKEMDAESWIQPLGPWIGHVHLHNNDGVGDLHRPLGEGVLDMDRIISALEEHCPDATLTIENIRAADSVRWLLERGYL